MLHCWQYSDHDDLEEEQVYIPPWQSNSRDRSKRYRDSDIKIKPEEDQAELTPEQKLENEKREKASLLYAKIQKCYVPDVFKTPKSMLTMSVG